MVTRLMRNKPWVLAVWGVTGGAGSLGGYTLGYEGSGAGGACVLIRNKLMSWDARALLHAVVLCVLCVSMASHSPLPRNFWTRLVGMCSVDSSGRKIMDCWDCTCRTSADYRPGGHSPAIKNDRQGNPVIVCANCGVGPLPG